MSRCNLPYSPSIERTPARIDIVPMSSPSRPAVEQAFENEVPWRLFERAPGFVCALSGPEHVFNFVNATHKKLFGSDEWLGRSVREVLPGVEEQGFIGLLDRVFRTGERQVSTAAPVRFRRSRADAEELHYLDFVYEAIGDQAGHITGVFCMGYDVTDRVLAQAAERAQAEQFAGSYDAAPIGLCVLDRGLRYVRINRRLAEWNGMSPAEHIGRSVHEVIPDLGPQLVEVMHRALSGETVWGFEVSGSTAADPEVTKNWRQNWVPLRDEQNNVVGIAVSAEDVTQQVAAERALRESEAHQRFLVGLGDRLRGLDDPKDVMAAAAEALGKHLAVARVGYGELDAAGEVIRVERDWSNGVASLAGECRILEGFGPAIAAELRAGHTLCVDDCRKDSRAAGEGLAAVWEGLSLQAIIAVPLLKNGRFVAFLYIHEQKPRTWRSEDVALASEVAERTWAAVERARAEAALAANERRLQLAKQAAGIGVWDWDLITNALEWSPEMYDLLGIDRSTPGHALYAAWTKVLHPEDRDRADAWAKQAAHSGTGFSVDERVILPNGEMRWIRAQAMALLDDDRRPVRLIGINLDVTAHYRLEHQLRREAESLSVEVQKRTLERNRLFELSSDLFAVAGLDGRFKINNPAWTKLLGYDDAELLQRTLVELIYPEDRGSMTRALAALSCGDTVQRVENRLMGKDGGLFWVAWTVVLEGDALYMVGRDVTREREQEEVLRQVQKMEAVGQLTGGIAHDFNNLLVAVLGGFDLIRRRADDPQRVRRIAEHGLAAAERGAKLTSQLLAFSRSQQIERRSLTVSKVVEGMRELLDRTLGAHIAVTYDLDSTLVPVLSDPTQLEMAVLNLAINARDAMPEGGRLTIRTVARQLQGDADLPAGEYVELAVSDTGLGMSHEVASRAFDPFFTTKGVGKGTGLGLSQVYGIARQTGGTARIESVPRQGTTVRLFLPKTTVQLPDDLEEVVADERGNTIAATILVIDDDDVVRGMLAESLRSLGYGVIEASTGEEGLKVLEERTPDLILLDFAMPGMNGAEVAAAVREKHPELPLLFSTGYADTAAIEHSVGSAPMLRKPFKVDELQVAVTEALGRRGRSR